ncbi:MAG: hypothetical protein IPM74_11570 [Crocinitomicaceae bacterium]|nr:hypothetical protein [Crocinitomicaceae bacterium]MBK8926518.1 hypothetical protein [Crocinitomicaceae bacterium]
MSPKHFTIILILLSALTCRAQSSIGINAHGNYSNRWTHLYEKDKYFFKPGYGFGLAYKYRFNEQSHVLVNISYEYAAFKKIIKKPTHVITYESNASLIDVPVFYSVDRKIFSVLFGLQFSFGVGNRNEIRVVQYDDGTTFGPYPSGWSSRILDIGPTVAISINASKNISFMASAYQGLIENHGFMTQHVYWTRFYFGFVYTPVNFHKRTPK